MSMEAASPSWFRRIATDQGLSDTQVNCICKDSSGYLWIGTSMGLNRYDGYRIKVFSSGSSSRGSLPANDVNNISQDHQGNLWINTPLGFYIFNPLTETFTADLQPWLQQRGITGKLGHIFFSPDGASWVEIHDKGIYHVGKNGGTTFFANSKLPKARVSHLTFDGTCCIVTYDNGAVAALNGSTAQVKWIDTHIPQQGGEEHLPYSTFIDSKGNMWLYGSRSLMRHDHLTKQWTTVSKLIVKDIVEDNKHRIWVATDHNGLMQLNHNGELMQHYTNNPAIYNSLPDNTPTCLYVGSNNTLWVGTYSAGLAYFHEANEANSQITLGDICTITQDHYGTLWCGTNDAGIITHDPASGTNSTIDAQQSGLSSNTVVSSMCHRNGSLWFGTYGGGLLCIDGNHKQVFRKSAGQLAHDNVWALNQTPDGRVVIGTLGGGVQIYDPQTQQFTTYSSAHGGLASDYISSLYVAPGGTLLVGHSQYFSTIDLNTGKVTNFTGTRSGKKFLSPTVNHIFRDSRGLIWLATSSGLNAYDPATDELYAPQINQDDRPCRICAVTEDRLGNIWVTTSNQIKRLKLTSDGNSWRFFINTYFSNPDGAAALFNKRAIWLCHDGKIVAGNNSGVCIIDPFSNPHSPLSDNVIFSDLMIFGQTVNVGDTIGNRVLLDNAINYNRHISLGNDITAFTIQLASSNISRSHECRFAYRLLGLSDRWMMTAEDQANISFTNLSPGDYRLEVRLIDTDGNPSKKVSTLFITMQPPFYLTLPAFAIYLALLLGALWVFYRFYRQKRDASLQQMELRKAQELEEMKLVFFTNISHELRTPLSLIITPLQSIIDKETNQEIRQRLMLISQNAHRLLQMVNQILDLRRLMKDGDRLQLSSGDIVDFLRNLSNHFINLTSKNLHITFYSAIPSLIIDFDRAKMEKILSNLLSNAIKFTPQGGRIDIELSLHDEFLHLRVADNGIGIPDSEKPHIFNRFYQCGANTASGSGIGLNLVHDFTQMHGGTVEVSDNPGGGSVFTVKIPARHNSATSPAQEPDEAPQPVVTSTENAESASPLQENAQNGKTLLLVDDSTDFLEFMASELSSQYHVMQAHNGEEALEMMKEQVPHIVLTDVMMPQMDGNELCRAIKADPRTAHVPVVMLTARLSEEHEMHSRECGTDDYITKPFNLDLLKVRLQNIVSHIADAKPAHLQPVISVQSITSADEKLVNRATQYVEQHLDDPNLSVEVMSTALGMSRVNLYRRILSVTGNTPSEFIRLVRLRHAEQLLARSQLTVQEIAYKVGFSSTRYFARCFNDLYG
ncbi:MAG: two-component regulator propeller domain-containing protein [Muribaculaceae bacterium]